MKIHVILDEQALDKVLRKSDASLKRYLDRMKIRGVNVSRMKRHGVISGEVESESQIHEIEQKRGVASVEVDSSKSAIGA